MTNNIIVDLSMDFSIYIVNLCDGIKGKSAKIRRGAYSFMPQAFQETLCVSFQDGFAVISSAQRISSEAAASQPLIKKGNSND